MVASEADGNVDDLLAGSSPVSASAPVLAGAGVLGVTNRVAGSIQPWRLAIPDANHSVVFLAGERGNNLAAHDRRGSEFLVEPRLVDDVELIHDCLVADEFPVEASEWRAW